VLLTGVAVGQASSPPTLKPRPNTSVVELETTGEKTKISPDAPVVTVPGLCEKPANSSATPSDCKTVITRAEFEKITNAVQPNMPAAAKKQFATRYILVLVLAEKAHEMGLDQGPGFDAQMQIARLQILAKEAGQRIQEEASKVSDSEIEEYYRQHSADYKTITYERLYVPKQKETSTVAQKPGTPDAQKVKSEETEVAMKEEAEKLRTRAAAGEDFSKLQQGAYDFAGSKVKASNPRVENVRKANVPASAASIFDLKKGEVSQVFSDPSAFMIYKVESVQDLPLTGVHDEIFRTLQAQKVKNAFDTLQSSTKPTFDDAYFATPAPPTMRSPGELPATQAPAPGKK
jgi:hypothetical protein